jgi:hypothetical protein
LGRGGRSNHHSGNERFRELIGKNRPHYNDLPKHEKIKMSRAIVRAIEDLGGRFLEPAQDGHSHFLVAPHKRAVEKTSQCLREKRADRVGLLKPIAAATASNIATAGTPTNSSSSNNNDDDDKTDDVTSNSSQQAGTTSKAA